MSLVKGLLDHFTWFNWLSDRSQEINTTPPPALPSSVSPQKKSSPTAEIDLKRIVPSPEDLKDISPISYAYDPVPVVATYLSPLPLSFPSRASQSCPHLSRNSTRVYPLSGGLPYRSSLNYVRGCKHFQANFLESIAVLESIVAEKATADIPVGKAGITLAGLAQKELRPGIADRMALATNYMFPGADEKRLRIIATFMILYFLFDDKVEETPEGAPLKIFRKDFLSHLRDPSSFVGEPTGDFQRHTRATMKAIWEEDAISGNGGREMVEALRDAFRCVHPEGDFQSVEAYLQFRRLNVGARFVIAAAKFSIRSNVNVADPRFARYLSLIGDHYGIINDVASFEKEARALKNGDTNDMINIVSVIQNLLSMPGEEAARVASYSYQLQVESWIMEELEELARNGNLTDEEWWFLEAVFLTATGNTFFCMTSARYGGKAASIDAAW